MTDLDGAPKDIEQGCRCCYDHTCGPKAAVNGDIGEKLSLECARSISESIRVDLADHIAKNYKSNPNAWLYVLLLAVPFAWVAHFKIGEWGHKTTFVLCFISMIPMQKTFDWGGEKLGVYLGRELRDLLVITLCNAIEAALAIILLLKCKLRLLQSTLIGVVLLQMLLVPGISFFIQGSALHEQKLHPQYNSLNHSLSMIGALGIFVPTAFFAALDRGAPAGSTSAEGLPSSFVPLVSDSVRTYLLHMSRGFSVILLVVYVASRLYRHVWHKLFKSHHHNQTPKCRQCACSCSKRSSLQTQVGPIETIGDLSGQPKGAGGIIDDTSGTLEGGDDKPHANKGSDDKEKHINPWVCSFIVLVAVGSMIPTAEFLVSSIEDASEISGIEPEWFGLILLPIISFSADGMVICWKFLRKRVPYWSAHLHGAWTQTHLALKKSYARLRGTSQRKDVTTKRDQPGMSASTGHVAEDDGLKAEEDLETEFAHWRPLDLSIQFMLLWMPFVVLLGWWTDRPVSLLFDYFEVAILLSACFLMNYVTVDAKTNMSEGVTMIAFYAMIATAAWFYPGQPQVELILSCPGSVAAGVAKGITESAPGLMS